MEEKSLVALGEAHSVRTQQSGWWDWLGDGELQRYQSRRRQLPKSIPDGTFSGLHLPVLSTSLRGSLGWVHTNSILVSACCCGLV